MTQQQSPNDPSRSQQQAGGSQPRNPLENDKPGVQKPRDPSEKAPSVGEEAEEEEEEEEEEDEESGKGDMLGNNQQR